MPLTPFLTATGLLAAILLVWAQSWISIYEPGDLPATVGLGLVWTYLAVAVALAAFALASWSWSRKEYKENFRVRGVPLGLLVSALIMTGIDVCQSLVSTAIKFCGGDPLDQPLTKVEEILQTHALCAIIFVIIMSFIIIIMSCLGTKKRCWWIAETVTLVIFGIGVIIWICLN